MKEGGTEAPVRHAIPWQDESYYDTVKIDEELRRVFDICHGCRRCFNLCDSFPRLFDLIDGAPSLELDTVTSTDFGDVIDACTLCDMCFLTKCPYVPPHEFNLDFPHLMLRYRAAEFSAGHGSWIRHQLANTDRNGRFLTSCAALFNWASRRKQRLIRKIIEALSGISADAELPTFSRRRLRRGQPVKGSGRKAAIYATCLGNYNQPDVVDAARQVLEANGVETDIVYPGCCGMPRLEEGDLESVTKEAARIAKELQSWIDRGYDIVSVTASCSLMLKFEWPLLLPDNEAVQAVSAATSDIDEFVVALAKPDGLKGDLHALAGGVTLHHACHARAQNIGQKSAEMLRMIPDTRIDVIERCSGHGGTFGILKGSHEVAMKIGRPVFRDANRQADAGNIFVASDCPLAAKHIVQGMDRTDDASKTSYHPIELMSKAYEKQ